jgi:hypothetical protein
MACVASAGRTEYRLTWFARQTMKDPTPLDREGEFGLVPKGAPAEGHDAADDHIWCVRHQA